MYLLFLCPGMDGIAQGARDGGKDKSISPQRRRDAEVLRKTIIGVGFYNVGVNLFARRCRVSVHRANKFTPT